MIREQVDRRYVAGIRFVDAASGAAVTRGLRLESPEIAFFANRSGIQVAQRVAGWRGYEDAFEKPDPSTFAAADHVVTVVDPEGTYLPRTFVLSLPAAADTLAEVSLFRSVDAAVERNWCVLRGRLEDAADGKPLAGALLRVRNDADGTVRARAISFIRPVEPGAPKREFEDRIVGEFMIPIAGVPVVTWNAGLGPALAQGISATLEVIPFKPTQKNPIPDPDELDKTQPGTIPTENKHAVTLRSGGVIPLNTLKTKTS